MLHQRPTGLVWKVRTSLLVPGHTELPRIGATNPVLSAIMTRHSFQKRPDALLRGSKESLAGKIVRISLKPVVFGLAPFLRLFSILSDNIIWLVLGRTYIYNVSWEDPRVDHREFKLTEEDHVITLASAGEAFLHTLYFQAGHARRFTTSTIRYLTSS